MLSKIDDVHVERNIVEPEHVIIPNDPIVYEPAEPNVEIPSRKSKGIRRPLLFFDYVYLHERDFKILR